MKMKHIHIAIASFVVIAIFFVYYFFNPSHYSLFPKCPFHSLTGFDCPGCGSQRAIHALLNADIAAACNFNILLVASIPFLFIHFAYRAVGIIQKRNLKWQVIYHPVAPRVIFAIVVIFWIARNIPAYPFSYLAAGH